MLGPASDLRTRQHVTHRHHTGSDSASPNDNRSQATPKRPGARPKARDATITALDSKPAAAAAACCYVKRGPPRWLTLSRAPQVNKQGQALARPQSRRLRQTLATASGLRLLPQVCGLGWLARSINGLKPFACTHTHRQPRQQPLARTPQRAVCSRSATQHPNVPTDTRAHTRTMSTATTDAAADGADAQMLHKDVADFQEQVGLIEGKR